MANAIRHTPAGGTIQLRAESHEMQAQVTVTNPGPGIDPAHLPRLFDRFFRVDQARSDSASSGGLGLAIVRTIMDLHGGRSDVESEPGRLTTFRLVFPDRAASDESEALARRSPA